MTRAAVVDTNVLVTANRRAPQAGTKCVLACISALRQVREGLVLLDGGDRIGREYRRNASLSGQPGTGDAFCKWVWDHQAKPDHCRMVRITPKPEDPDDFEEFPNDPGLRDFDRSDRKWVAVALASDLAPRILNATDTDWWHHREALGRCGVHVVFLCPDLMTAGR